MRFCSSSRAEACAPQPAALPLSVSWPVPYVFPALSVHPYVHRMDKYASFHTVFCCLRQKTSRSGGTGTGRQSQSKQRGERHGQRLQGSVPFCCAGLQSKDRRAGRGRVMGHEHGRPLPRFLPQQFLHARGASRRPGRGTARPAAKGEPETPAPGQTRRASACRRTAHAVIFPPHPRGRHARAIAGLLQPCFAQHGLQVSRGRAPRQQAVLLETVGNAVRHAVIVPPSGPLQSCNAAQQRGLAAAGRPGDIQNPPPPGRRTRDPAAPARRRMI